MQRLNGDTAATLSILIPAKAGIQCFPRQARPQSRWIPACAGMTGKNRLAISSWAVAAPALRGCRCAAGR
ncbi:hypothetical protein EZM97_15730 [Dyella soli]|uniref:Uncharacterized protein n=1 Tax=Dyella soli TaxID=522319 RepID=A0A4R0YUY1_9GAMM|nr:hypothetical protein EZM97_15730 [Dyella soli]